jgi:hypothetical protein
MPDLPPYVEAKQPDGLPQNATGGGICDFGWEGWVKIATARDFARTVATVAVIVDA